MKDDNRKMRKARTVAALLAAVLLSAFWLAGCASLEVDPPVQAKRAPAGRTRLFPRESKPPAAVLPLALGLSRQAVIQYPRLARKSVGLGVYHLLLSAVARSDLFAIVEIRPENVEAILRERWLQRSGLMADRKVAEQTRDLAVRYAIYGRVYEYAETVSEKIVGLETRRELRCRIGVQLICLEIGTMRRVGVASAVGIGDSVLSATRSAVAKAADILSERLFFP